MTEVLLTVDTELSALLHQRGMSPSDNLASSIRGHCQAGEFGIGWQMDVADRYDAKVIFFVDPLPALVYGNAIVTDIVSPILERGHEVQLHIHTEWLEWAKHSPVGGRQGRNLADFNLADQITLLRIASDLLERAGAPRPIAFRAGNFGANDDSLRALAELGVAWDSSFNASYTGRGCNIDCPSEQIDPIFLNGVHELPVSGIHDRPGHIRPAQICALSAREMRAALRHAAAQRQRCFAAVTHSFEMLSRDRQRPNRIVMGRFRDFCSTIATTPGLRGVGFSDLQPSLPGTTRPTRLRPDYLRTLHRMGAQAIATWIYERQLRPV